MSNAIDKKRFSTSLAVSAVEEDKAEISMRYAYSRNAMKVVKIINLDDIDSIRKHYGDSVPRTLKEIPLHVLGVSPDFSVVHTSIKWFLNLNATDRQKEMIRCRKCPAWKKDMYKNNIDVIKAQQKILNQELASIIISSKPGISISHRDFGFIFFDS